MTITAGRFVWPTGVAVLEDRSRLTVDGAELVVRLYGQSSADVWDLVSWCRIVRGLVQPFTVSDEPSLSRWWRVEAADVDSLGVAATGEVVLRLSLGVIRDGGLPLVESLLHGEARRRTWLGVPAANAKAWHAVPLSGLYHVQRPAGVVTPVANRSAASGTVAVWTSTVDADLYQGASAQQPAVAVYELAPSDAYLGACCIEVELDGTWRTIHGLELPPLIGPSQVRITNGLTRVTGESAGPTVEAWDSTPGEWTDPINIAVASALTRVRVVRNAPEVVVVEWGSGSGMTLTATLRRGLYLPVFRATSTESVAWQVDVTGRTGTMTALTNADSAPAGANTIVLSWVLGERAGTVPSDRLRWTMQAPGTGRDSASFTGGILPPGIDAQTEIDYWHAQQSERVRVPS